jgi:hypothetical protein
VRGVLGQPAEPHLNQTGLALDHSERMLDLGPNAGLAVFLLLGLRSGPALGQLGDVARLGCDVPLQVVAVYPAWRSSIARVGPDLFLLAMQQVGHLRDVRFIGCSGGDGVHQAAIGVRPDERLHPEEPLVALLGLVHLGISCALGVLGVAGRGNDGRVHNAATLEQQTFARQQRIDHLQIVLGLDVEAGDYERSDVEFAALPAPGARRTNSTQLLAEVENLASAISKLLPTGLLPYSFQ